MVMECVKPVVVPPHLIKHFSPPPLTLLTEITVMPLINFSSASSYPCLIFRPNLDKDLMRFDLS